MGLSYCVKFSFLMYYAPKNSVCSHYYLYSAFDTEIEAKYGLTKEEIRFIDSMIKQME